MQVLVIEEVLALINREGLSVKDWSLERSLITDAELSSKQGV